MVSLFRERSAASVFWIIILSLVLHAHFFIDPPEVLVVREDGLLYDMLQPLTFLPNIVIVVIYQVVLIIAALRSNYVLNDLRMFGRPAFTSAMSYILLASLFIEWNNILPALVIHIVLIWLFNKVARLYNNPHPKTLVFNIGLIAGCIQLLMPSFFTLPVFCLVALAMLRPFSMDEWVILILGCLTPSYFLGVVLFMQDDLASILQYFPFSRFHSLRMIRDTNMLINAILFGLYIIVGFVIWQQNTGRMLIQSRKNWGVLILLLLFMVPVLFVYKGEWLNIAFLFVLPVSALASNIFFYPKKAFIPNFFFWISFAAVIYNNWVK